MAGMEARAGLPLRQRETEANTSGGWGIEAVRLRAKLGSGFLIACVGQRGTGKTRLAVAVARELFNRCITAGERHSTPALYVKAMTLFLEVRATYKSAQATELRALKRYADARLLIIDECQERGDTAWEDRVLTYLIDERYGAKRDTLILANLKPDKLAETLGTSIASRIVEAGEVIECNWPSFRARHTGNT